MAVGLKPAGANALLNSQLRGTALSPTAVTTPMKLKLHTADPGAAGTTSEVAGGSYAAQTITFTAASGGACVVTSDVDFTGMPACTVSHVSIWDSAGTPIFVISGTLSSSVVLSAGDTFRLTASGSSVALTVAA